MLIIGPLFGVYVCVLVTRLILMFIAKTIAVILSITNLIFGIGGGLTGLDESSLPYISYIYIVAFLVGSFFGLISFLNNLRDHYPKIDNSISMLEGIITPSYHVIAVKFEHPKISLEGTLDNIQEDFTKRQVIPRVGDTIEINERATGFLTKEWDGTIKSSRAEFYLSECKVHRVEHNPPLPLNPPFDHKIEDVDVLVTLRPTHNIDAEDIEVEGNWR